VRDTTPAVTQASEPSARERPSPLRVLGVFDASMLVIGNVVGAGIFLVGADVAQRTQSAFAFLALWLVGGAFAFSGALCNGELGAMFPRGGGEYVYLSRAYGPSIGFLSGWTSFWIGFPGSIATLAAGFARETAALTGASVRAQSGIAMLTVVVLTAINALGMRPGKWVQNVLSVAKLIAFAAALVVGVAYAPAADAGTSVPGPEHASSLAIALIPIYFAYSGWNAVTYVAGEMKDPKRDLGRALAFGTAACVILYVAVNGAFLRTLGIEGMRGVPNVAGAATGRIFGTGGDRFVTALVIVAVLSSLQATVQVGPRIYQAMAEDGLFFPSVARLHPRTRVPVLALVLQGVISCGLIGIGSAFDQKKPIFDVLLTFTTFALVLFSVVTVAAVFVLRWRSPDRARPFRTPGYPFTPALYVIGNVWVLYSVLAFGTKEAFVGLGIVLSGLPFYWYFRRAKARRTPHELL
jgi:APA family basic amino acid/polyamine antiporter